MYRAWVDGAAYYKIRRSTIGYIIVDSRNVIIHKYGAEIPFCISEKSELRALRECLTTLQSYDIDDATIYTDYQSLVDRMYGTAQCPQRYRTVRNLLQQMPNVRLEWIPRAKNVVAHGLCRIPRRERRRLVEV